MSPLRRRTPIALAGAGAVAVLCSLNVPAHADVGGPPTTPWFSVGPSAGPTWYPARTNGFSYGLDATVSVYLFWLSGGARVLENREPSRRAICPYGEAGIWLGLNIGGGYTYCAHSATANDHGPQLFLGAPLPIFGEQWFPEPYYRAAWLNDGAVHEFGLLVKWTTFDF